MTALLALQRATIGYPGSPVLLDVSLEIRQGDAVAVLGPNGSGKTTLLKTLAGILPPLKGSFRSVSNGTRSLGRVGYIPQRTSLRLLLPLTVHEVVEMGSYGRLKPWQQVGTAERDRIEWALGAVGMVPLENECYSNLSGGQQQRVLIARALVTDPQVLILDEPLASLDQQSVQGLMGLLGRLRAEKKVALLWADHFVPALRGVVSEAIRIEGNTVLRGTLEEMLSWEGLGRPSEPTGMPS